MRQTRAIPAALLALGLLALTQACRGGGSSDTHPSDTSLASASPSPVSTAPVNSLSPGDWFTLYAADPEDHAGAIAAGDFNGDGVKDAVLTAAMGDGPQNQRPDAGEAYIFVGPFETGGSKDVAQGQYDLVVYGADPGDQLGRALAVGDFNGDRIDDLALGAPFGDGPDMQRSDSGQVYVLFGSEHLGQDPREFDLTGGGQNATIFGGDAGDLAGFTLQADDFNGDGKDDLLIGALQADGPSNQRPDAGEAYVIFGADQPPALDLSVQKPDVTIFGAELGDRLAEAVGAGDFDGDGRADIIVAATFADGPANDREAAGEVYVILDTPGPIVDLNNEFTGLVIFGIDPGDQTGHSMASGDTNGDSFDDLMLGAPSADGAGNTADLAGEAYLVLGGHSSPSRIDLAAQVPAALIYGASPKARLGRSMAMGDLNGDDLDDLLITAPDVPVGDIPDESRFGAIYAFYGRPGGPYPTTSSRADLTVAGLHAGDILGHEAFGMPSLISTGMNEDGLADILVSAPQAGGPGGKRKGAGEAYVIPMKAQ